MIAVDVMGGDNAPRALVDGAVCAARQGIPVLLCGVQEALMGALPDDWNELPIHLQFCTEQVSMDEEPSRAVRTKKDSSLVCALKAVAEGRADALFSAGNSGAVLVGSVLFLERVHGIKRPAIGTFLPSKEGSFFCVDIGGNVDCKPEHFYQFALMGYSYLQAVHDKALPRIALLSNGHEAYKGSDSVKKAYQLLQESTLNFIGNIESRDVMVGGCDLLICDGFVGNVLLKAMQGTAHALFDLIKDAADQAWWHRVLLWLNRSIFRDVKKRLDYAATGGALLLGVNEPVIVAHGCSDARAVANGIQFAYTVVQENQVARSNKRLLQLIQERQLSAGFVHESGTSTRSQIIVDP